MRTVRQDRGDRIRREAAEAGVTASAIRKRRRRARLAVPDWIGEPITIGQEVDGSQRNRPAHPDR